MKPLQTVPSTKQTAARLGVLVLMSLLLLLTGGCLSPEERVHYDHMEKLQRAHHRGELSDEEFRRAAHEVDYLRPP